MSGITPRFKTLSREEIHEVLSRNCIGRIAYAKGSSIDIEPLLYVYHEGWLYGRTSRVRQLKTTGESWWPVAFEIDEVKGPFDWKSVVIHGGFYTLSPGIAGWEGAQYEKAVDLLRTLNPAIFTDDDPTPFRNVVFRIAVQEATGKSSETDPDNPVQLDGVLVAVRTTSIADSRADRKVRVIANA